MEQQNITAVKGIGEKTAKLFQKIGVETVEELLHYYPRAYDEFKEPQPIAELKEDTIAAVSGILAKTADVVRYGARLQVTTAGLRDSGGTLALAWYNMPYLRGTLKAGERFIFRGRVVKKRGRLTMEQPEIYRPEQYAKVVSSMQPVYGQTKGLGNKTIAKAVTEALTMRQMEREYLPAGLREKYGLAEINYALEHIHFPANREELMFSRKRLVFDEFFIFLMSVRLLKDKKEDKKSAYPFTFSGEMASVEERLPYALTGAQKKVIREVYADLSGGHIMTRLIQGDVGSGKTIVAILALLQAAANGYQGALMVPTEVLARQHYESMTELFASLGITYRPVLLTGSMTAKEKRLARESIENHEADIVIGTHALIQEKVQYNNLGLVITDEQHRFGVKQREALTTMGNPPNVLVMSATPIPRTLAIIIYGDLDISVIDELPAQRLPIKNCVVDTSYRPKAYSFMEKQIRQGRQVYVICPMVEESEGMDGENVLDYTLKLRNVFSPDIKIASLHGKMKAKEKNVIMEAFAAGEIQILVSTTVVEVGVNVPNATVMMVENAERFGLAQLHQLRGRVGRGEYQSYCIFMQGNGAKEISKRLQILNKSNDGFYIAGEDLKLRGPGDLFGIRQSGLLEFKLGDIYQDADILKAASETASEILSLDADLSLPQNEELQRRLSAYMKEDLQNLGL